MSSSSQLSSAELEVRVSKIIVFVALAYLVYITVTCPCRPELYKCHLTQIYSALAIVVANLMWFNGLRVVSYH